MTKGESVFVPLGEAGADGSQPPKKVVKFFGIPMSTLPVTLQLIFLTALVFIFYLMYGYVLVRESNVFV